MKRRRKVYFSLKWNGWVDFSLRSVGYAVGPPSSIPLPLSWIKKKKESKAGLSSPGQLNENQESWNGVNCLINGMEWFRGEEPPAHNPLILKFSWAAFDSFKLIPLIFFSQIAFHWICWMSGRIQKIL